MTQDERMDRERMDRMQREIDELRFAISTLRQRGDFYPERRFSPWDEILRRPWWSDGGWHC